MWLTAQQPAAPVHSTLIHEPPPAAHIEEIIESHIFQVVTPATHSPEPENEPQDIFEVFMAEKRRQEKVTKPSEPAEPVNAPPPPADTNTAT